MNSSAPLTMTKAGTTQMNPMSMATATHHVPLPRMASFSTVAAKTWMATTPATATTRRMSRAGSRPAGADVTLGH
nr:hypothetical protein [Microbacterium flavescens]